MLEQQLVENLLREDLKPIEQARAFSSLMKLNGWNGKQVANALRVSPSTVSRALALLDLPADIQQQLEQGTLSARSAYELSKLDDEDSIREVADSSHREKLPLTQKQAKAAVNQRRGKQKPTAKGYKQKFFAENDLTVLVSATKKVTYHEVEQALSEALEEVQLYIKSGRKAN